MIYIFSQDFEYTTERVLDWLRFFEQPVKRINGSSFDKKDNIKITIDNEKENQIVIDNDQFVKNSVGWYRRFGKASLYKKASDWNLNFDFLDPIFSTIKSDRKVMKNFLIHELNIKEWLTEPHLASVNKLNVLTLAKKNGLRIPSTLIASSKEALFDFLKKHPQVIVKAISEAPSLSNFKEWHTYLTHKIEVQDLDSLPDIFPPTCFQEMIQKEYEIRVFYLDNKCYSMAIFSQKDQSTSVDFRNYNMEKPNRNVPYLLPEEITHKIQFLMAEIGLNCGSIDLIKDLNGNYIFLEVNPVGQFGMVSHPCNYYLEKKVAEHLITTTLKTNHEEG